MKTIKLKPKPDYNGIFKMQVRNMIKLQDMIKAERARKYNV